MYSAAPRWSEAVSPRSVPACGRSSPSSAANAGIATNSMLPTSMPASAGRILRRAGLVMRRHPVRYRLGVVELGPQRHGDEEHEVEESQDAADDHFRRIGTRAGTDLAQPEEAHHEDRQHQPRQLAAIAIRLDETLVEPWHQEQHDDRAEHHQHAPELDREERRN